MGLISASPGNLERDTPQLIMVLSLDVSGCEINDFFVIIKKIADTVRLYATE